MPETGGPRHPSSFKPGKTGIFFSRRTCNRLLSSRGSPVFAAGDPKLETVPEDRELDPDLVRLDDHERAKAQ
jgi:hypothetical protein